MLATLFPKSAQRYLSLPLFGSVMEDFADWLVGQNYTRIAYDHEVLYIGARITAKQECLVTGLKETSLGIDQDTVLPCKEEWCTVVALTASRDDGASSALKAFAAILPVESAHP